MSVYRNIFAYPMLWVVKVFAAICLLLLLLSKRNDTYTITFLSSGLTGEKIRADAVGGGLPCHFPGLQNFSQFFAVITTVEIECQNPKKFGRGASVRSICLDERFKMDQNNCVVFSFGINHDFTFEDALGKFGCKVFAYDPTMGVKDHQHSANVSFIGKGISNYKGEKVIGMGKSWHSRQVDTFENLVEAAGMAGKPIDVVKLDVELSELDFLQDMLFNSRSQLMNIKQLAMEIHSNVQDKEVGPTSTHQIFWPYLHLMRCAGFKLISSRFADKWREVVWAQDKHW